MSIKQNLFIMCGIPASGKSFFIESKALKDINKQVCISRDEIRYEMLENEIKHNLIKNEADYFSKEDLVFKEYVKRIVWSLNAGFDVFADSTNLNIASRRKLLNAIKRLDKNVLNNTYIHCIVIDTPYQECLKRNNKRSNFWKVPVDSMRKMRNALHFPTKEENFDTVSRYDTIENKLHIVKLEGDE